MDGRNFCGSGVVSDVLSELCDTRHRSLTFEGQEAFNRVYNQEDNSPVQKSIEFQTQFFEQSSDSLPKRRKPAEHNPLLLTREDFLDSLRKHQNKGLDLSAKIVCQEADKINNFRPEEPDRLLNRDVNCDFGEVLLQQETSITAKSVSWVDYDDTSPAATPALSPAASAFNPQDGHGTSWPPGLLSNVDDTKGINNHVMALQHCSYKADLLAHSFDSFDSLSQSQGDATPGSAHTTHSAMSTMSSSFSPYGSPQDARRCTYPDSSSASVTPTKPQYPAMPFPPSFPPGYASISNSSYGAMGQGMQSAMQFPTSPNLSTYHRSKLPVPHHLALRPSPRDMYGPSFVPEDDQSLFESPNYRRKDVMHDTKPRRSVRQLEACDGYIYHVNFKRAHKNYVLLPSLMMSVDIGDVVKVEADRGEDVGTIIGKTLATEFRETKLTAGFRGRGFTPNGIEQIRYITGLASPYESAVLVMKAQEEEAVLQNIRNTVQQQSLNMGILDVEFQFDHHKLTVFFEARDRVDFRDLVSSLFSLYKTRIWMQQVEVNNPVVGSSPALGLNGNSAFPSALSHSYQPAARRLDFDHGSNMGSTMSRAGPIGGEADRGLLRAPAGDGSQPLMLPPRSTSGPAMYGSYHSSNAGPTHGYSDGDTNHNNNMSGLWQQGAGEHFHGRFGTAFEEQALHMPFQNIF